MFSMYVHVTGEICLMILSSLFLVLLWPDDGPSLGRN